MALTYWLALIDCTFCGETPQNASLSLIFHNGSESSHTNCMTSWASYYRKCEIADESVHILCASDLTTIKHSTPTTLEY